MAGQWTMLAAGAIVAASLGGCVNNKEYQSLYKTNHSLEERNVMLQQELDAAQTEAGLLRDRVKKSDSTLTDARDRNAELQSQVLRVREDYRTLAGRLNNISVSPLDPTTDAALKTLAANNTDIMRYDAGQGMIQLMSDLTFSLGSTEVTSSAKNALTRIAQVLSNPAAAKYDARIVGHTDNVPIRKASTKRLHPTNLHLSVDRAIAVRSALVAAGVPANRLEVAGWGEFRPLTPNPAKGGAAANRRVEIYLTPTTANQTQAASAPPATPDSAKKEANAEEPLK